MDTLQLIRLLDESRKGDRDSFGRLVSAYQARVCSVTYGLTGSVEQSEDLAQEAFVAAWRALGDLRELEKFPSWVCGIARNLARKALRRRERNTLDQSQALSAEPIAATEDASDRLDRQETEEIVWETLESIPETYREPLVMFYREDGSIRSIAEALDISEDSAKQRLSRGRQMLKAKVAALVESTLEQTRPGTGFTIAVLAGLPTLSSQAMAASTVASAAGKTATAGGTTSVVAAGAVAGILGGLLGTLAGMSGGFFGMWASIRNSPTLRTQRYSLRMCGTVYAQVWLFLGAQAVGFALLWQKPNLIGLWMTFCWIAYVPILIYLIWSGNRTYARILAEDRGEQPASMVPLEESVLSRDNMQRLFRWSLVLAIIGSVGSLGWIVAVPSVRSYWLAAAPGLVLCHLVFREMFRRGMRMAHDEASFEAFRSADQITQMQGVPHTCPRCGSKETKSLARQALYLTLVFLAIVILQLGLVAIQAAFGNATFIGWFNAGLCAIIWLPGVIMYALIGKHWRRCTECHRDFGYEFRTKATLLGMPLVCIGNEFDPATGKDRPCRGIIAVGHFPRGFIAIGDLAVGFVAFGGGALGFFSIGGGSLGVISFGGGAIGLAVAFGGLAIAPIAIGGMAIGYYAFGGGALGGHTFSALSQDPVAVEFFNRWVPGLLPKKP